MLKFKGTVNGSGCMKKISLKYFLNMICSPVFQILNEPASMKLVLLAVFTLETDNPSLKKSVKIDG